MIKIKNCSLIFAMGLLLTNCVVQKASIEFDTKAKQLIVPNNKALVYVVRPKSLGGAIRFTVDCDNRYIGSTVGRRYIYSIQDTGKHKIVSHAENSSELEISLDVNQKYYIEQVPKFGIWIARNRLELIDESKGKKKLMKCKLSDDCIELK